MIARYHVDRVIDAGMLHPDTTYALTTLTILSLVTTQQPWGTAQLVQTRDNKTILIDGGADTTSLAQSLDSRLPPWQRSLDGSVRTQTTEVDRKT